MVQGGLCIESHKKNAGLIFFEANLFYFIAGRVPAVRFKSAPAPLSAHGGLFTSIGAILIAGVFHRFLSYFLVINNHSSRSTGCTSGISVRSATSATSRIGSGCCCTCSNSRSCSEPSAPTVTTGISAIATFRA